jgi:SpoIIAA-like
MAHEILEIRDAVIKLRLSGLLTRADMTSLQELAVQMIERGRQPRLLVILDHFQGWARTDDWNEFDFMAEHGDDIVRIALVGDERWKDETYLFVGKGLRATEIEFFSPAALGEAERWVAL